MNGPLLVTGRGGDGANNGSTRVMKVGGTAVMTFNALAMDVDVADGYPITCTFNWGDGGSNVTVITAKTTTTCSAMHLFNVAGTYAASVVAQDSFGMQTAGGAKFVIYSVGASAPTWKAYIEGEGKVANLTRTVFATQPIMAFIENSGPNVITGPITVSWFQNANPNNWANMIYSVTYFGPGSPAIMQIYPGEIWPFSWPGNIPQVVTSTGTLFYWVKTVAQGINVTSSHFPVFYGNNVVAPAMAVAAGFGSSILMPAYNKPALNSWTFTNTGSFTLNIGSTVTQSSASNDCFPTLQLAVNCAIDSRDVTHAFGPIVNGSVQTDYWQAFPFAAGFGSPPITPAPPIFTLDPFPYFDMGALVQPGQSLTLPQWAFIFFTAQGEQSSYFYTMNFIPFAAGSCLTVSQCSMSGPATSIATTILFGTQLPTAAIQTVSAQQTGNGSVIFTGRVTSLGGQPYLDTWFQFTVPNGTTYVRPTLRIFGTQTVLDYVFGLGAGNYSVTFMAVTPAGTQLTGGALSFFIGTGAGTNNPASNGQGAVQNFLFSMAVALNMPAVLLGLILGLFLIFGGIVLLLMGQYFFETEIPPIVWLPMLLVMAGVNIALFLWPDWLALVIFVVIGLLIWREFNASGAGGGTSG